MAIPMNTTDIELVAKQNAAKFAAEIDQVETDLFTNCEWRNEHGVEHLVVFSVTEYTIKGVGTIKLYDEHWNAIAKDVKGAGYYMYRKIYHNGYYNETDVHAYYITKTPLTSMQRTQFYLQSEYSTPCGPGRECFRGEVI